METGKLERRGGLTRHTCQNPQYEQIGRLKNGHGAVPGLFVTYYVASDECAQLINRYAEHMCGLGFRILSFHCFRWGHGWVDLHLM